MRSTDCSHATTSLCAAGRRAVFARLAILAAAVLDGTGVDWPAEEADPTSLTPSYVGNLKLVAAIADVHRAAPSPGAETPQR